MLGDAHRRGRHADQADTPVPRSIMPQSGWGYEGTPAVWLTLDGAPFMAPLVFTDVRSSVDTISFTHVAASEGIVIESRWSIAASGMVVSEVSITNNGKHKVGVLSLASLALPLPGWASHATHYSGRWAGEMRGERAPLQSGVRGATSHGGRPGFGGGNWIRIEAADTHEGHGAAIAAHLAWSGDHFLHMERNADGEAMLLMGARLQPGAITLASGESWKTPDAIFAVSDDGIAATRHIFHQHALNHTIPPSTLAAPRRVHLNSWEALDFNLARPALLALVDAASALGVERFVLDDGWFMGRRDDTTSLGDWTPDPTLFPDGLAPLIAHVERQGMDFGLWVEPEMVSPDSDLYRKNPDWCLNHVGQPRPTQRGQLVLDLTIPAVTDHLFERLDALLRDHRIAYLKWDHNRDLFPQASPAHAQVRSLYRLLDRLRDAHPAVEIETCASGGGRVDFAMLQRCTRFWASDNNDAIERLRINRGWFDFLPLAIIGNHIGPSPNPITGRALPVDFCAKVALFGHMGVEANPLAMSESDRAVVAAHIALYKQWRPVLHGGQLHAIVGDEPGIHGWFAWRDGRGIALVAQTCQAIYFDSAPIRIPGLNRAGRYRVRLLEPLPTRTRLQIGLPEQWATGLVLSGQFLAETGILLPLRQPETAVLLSIETED